MTHSTFVYYIRNILLYLLPNGPFRRRLPAILAALDSYDPSYIRRRVNYYNRLQTPFRVDETFTQLKALSPSKRSFYFFDLFEYMRYFDPNVRFKSLFGDITHIPDTPSIVKSRPIAGDHANSVLLKLEKYRHFYFPADRRRFESKLDTLAWRGACYQPHRIPFVRRFHDHPLCDIGQTNKPAEKAPWQKPRMSISAQRRHKFLFSIEGNDVASNLKWGMASNSLVFMPRPRYETWFMEGALQPGFHYVLIDDDFSNLEEMIRRYSQATGEALGIIGNAHRYVQQFQNPGQEDLICLLVLKKYLELSGQL